MRRVAVSLAALLVSLFLPVTPLAGQSDEEDVLAVINQLFEGMRTGDSSMVRAVFHPRMTMASIFVDREGVPRLAFGGGPDDFVEAVGTPHEERWDERIWDPIILVDGNMAAAWTPYAFYLDDQLRHCGTNSFQLFRGADGWQIIRLTDTRRRSGCDPQR